MTTLSAPQILVADARHLDAMMTIMAIGFDAEFGEAWSANQVAESLLLASSFARQATDAAGRIVGFTLSRAAASEVELLLIAVEPRVRGQGIGRRLIDTVIGDAAQRGASEVFLEVRENNVAAQQLYLSAGFVDVGRRLNYYTGAAGNRFSAITMRRAIQR
jgi:[ribosomal protein S18]-alanine N-acetyltransferase